MKRLMVPADLTQRLLPETPRQPGRSHGDEMEEIIITVDHRSGIDTRMLRVVVKFDPARVSVENRGLFPGPRRQCVEKGERQGQSQ